MVLGLVFPSYVVIVGIWKPVARGACWISRLKGELVVEGTASKLLAANFSRYFLSLLISSCMGENVGRSRWSWGSVFPSYVVIVGIWKPVGRGACWISRLKDELVVEGAASELLASNLSSHFLSLLISSCTGENIGRSFFFDEADVLLASR